ncbi:MAG: FAD-dependent oxidoreductase, partial [Acidimicrobiia bacterium]
MPADPLRFLIIGAGPAGTAAATNAAALGAKVTLAERSVVGGAAHLWDCIPSKTMTATAVRIDSMRNAPRLGLVAAPGSVDSAQLANRISTIAGDINRSWESLLKSQAVEIVTGTARLVGPNEAVVDDGPRIPFDRCLLSTGSEPRVPDWAPIDGQRILTTRDVYDLAAVPEKIIVIGSGVTGVEFV